MSKFNLSHAIALTVLLAAPLAAQAATPSGSPNLQSLQTIAGLPVTSHVLAGLHGKGITINPNYATDTGNSAQGATGNIYNSNSVTGDTGFTNVIQNTGNNSLFQTSTVVNINLN